MTEFKQIIGRGTRIREDYNKYYFTIIDFRSVTKLFADPAFDGDPVKIKETSGAIPSEEENPANMNSMMIQTRLKIIKKIQIPIHTILMGEKTNHANIM
jgi:type I site-specific restriction endonuclease